MEEREDFDEKIEYISTSGVYKTPYTFFIIISQLFFGGFVLLIVNLWFINSLYFLVTQTEFYSSGIKAEWYFWLLVPLNIYGNLFLFFISVTLFSVIWNKILLKLFPIKEGVFKRESKDFKYMQRRFWTAYFPIWLARALPLPWADIFVYRFFGVRIGKNVVAYEGYIDPELVEIGDFTMTSLNICIFSHLIYHDKVLIKKVKIGKACVIGPHTIVSPGSRINDNAVLGANSYTDINQELKSDLIHVGLPVKKSFPIQSLEESIEKVETIKKKDNNF